mmetsp:Transcript_26696/g.69768  ORF Transcript_26696/g.69768 Transcript_26696/m.69768 type:complete len:361 (+) Transcript_26696:1102-2184(+)
MQRHVRQGHPAVDQGGDRGERERHWMPASGDGPGVRGDALSYRLRCERVERMVEVLGRVRRRHPAAHPRRVDGGAQRRRRVPAARRDAGVQPARLRPRLPVGRVVRLVGVQQGVRRGQPAPPAGGHRARDRRGRVQRGLGDPDLQRERVLPSYDAHLRRIFRGHRPGRGFERRREPDGVRESAGARGGRPGGLRTRGGRRARGRGGHGRHGDQGRGPRVGRGHDRRQHQRPDVERGRQHAGQQPGPRQHGAASGRQAERLRDRGGARCGHGGGPLRGRAGQAAAGAAGRQGDLRGGRLGRSQPDVPREVRVRAVERKSDIRPARLHHRPGRRGQQGRRQHLLGRGRDLSVPAPRGRVAPP